ncbi:MAG: hypothetical protein IJ636_07675 [Bacteroidales bacterium]|nr:hypothetical protein [Bacteroidales bacterium]
MNALQATKGFDQTSYFISVILAKNSGGSGSLAEEKKLSDATFSGFLHLISVRQSFDYRTFLPLLLLTLAAVSRYESL